MSAAAVSGWGAAAPSHELDNATLAARLGVDESWIFERTGVRSRHIADDSETTTSLAVRASTAALSTADIQADQVDLIIVATVTPDQALPGVAPALQTHLGATHAGAFDLNAACSGFLYALAMASSWIESGNADKVLVCGADTLSRITDYDDPRSCILFGDGAGAVILESSAQPGRLGPFTFGTDGSRPELLQIPAGDRFIRMAGRDVYRRAVEEMTAAVRGVLGSSGLAITDVDLLVAHQANARILDAVAARMGFPAERVFCNIDRFGNTSAASIPIALDEAASTGVLNQGDIAVLVSFGAGFTWGAGVVRWGLDGPITATKPTAEPTARPSTQPLTQLTGVARG